MQKTVKDLHFCWAGTRGSLHLTMSKVLEAYWSEMKVTLNIFNVRMLVNF